MPVIPDKELSATFSRSGGKGGQNVNKVSTKATLKWNVGRSLAMAPAQKERLALKLKNRLDAEGNVTVYSQNERSQFQNRAEAAAKLRSLVSAALRPTKKRIKTKPTRASRERRLTDKRIIAEKKRFRRDGNDD